MKVERPFFLQGLLSVSRVTIFHAKGIRNRRRVFRLPRRSGKYASVPRFVNPKIISVRIKLRGKSKKENEAEKELGTIEKSPNEKNEKENKEDIVSSENDNDNEVSNEETNS